MKDLEECDDPREYYEHCGGEGILGLVLIVALIAWLFS